MGAPACQGQFKEDETSACIHPAAYFDAVLRHMVCERCAARRDSKDWPLVLKSRPRLCYLCDKPASHRGNKGGGLVCQDHTFGIENLVTRLTEDEKTIQDVLVKVSIRNEAGWDVWPLTYVGNALGWAGWKVLRLHWQGDNPDSFEILLEIAADPEGSRLINKLNAAKIATLENSVAYMEKVIKTSASRITGLEKNCQQWEQAFNKAQEDFAQERLRFQHLLGDSRLESEELPLIFTPAEDRSV
jgi:hypothetical protein